MKTIIKSDHEWFLAYLEDTPEGISIEIMEKKSVNFPILAPVHKEVIDAPFHLIADQMFAIVNNLERNRRL